MQKGRQPEKYWHGFAPYSSGEFQTAEKMKFPKPNQQAPKQTMNTASSLHKTWHIRSSKDMAYTSCKISYIISI